MNSNRIEQIEVRKRLAVEDMARNLFIKNQDELDLLDVDPEKEAHLNRYRRNIVTMALCARKKQSPTIPFITSEVMTLP